MSSTPHRIREAQHLSTVTERVPFGMRYAARQTSAAPDTGGITYDHELQIAVTSNGNPWASMVGNDTSSNTNSDSQNDEGTDLYLW
jgi:putative ATP-grasp target RiPP